MVNNAFYSTMNELFKRAAKGTITAVVDYASFIDAGKSLTDLLSTDELHNEFLTPLMQKVQKTILDTPSYQGALTSMYAGRLDYGVLEIIMGDFYDMQASTFDGADTLVDGETYTDQFTVNLPKTTARYYTTSDSWERNITIRDTDLRGAFTSPSKMDAFIRKIFLDIANSNEFHKELNRLAVLADVIKQKDALTGEAADENKVAQKYKLLSIYNAKKGTNLSASDALYSDDFIRFAVAAIRDIKILMTKPTDKFNLIGEITTFSPLEDQTLKINAIFDKAIRTSLVDAYNPEYGMIQGDYEVLPYWQNNADRLRVTTNTEDESVTAYSSPVLAVLLDKRVNGEMVQLEEVATTRNAKRHYTNYHYDFNYMYWTNMNANAVIFVLA